MYAFIVKLIQKVVNNLYHRVSYPDKGEFFFLKTMDFCIDVSRVKLLKLAEFKRKYKEH